MTKLAGLLVLVAIIVATVYRLPGDIDRVVTDGIAYYGSVMTKAPVSATDVRITATSGKGTISNLRIGNPAGFRTTPALRADRVDIEIDMASITQDVIVIRVITIDGPNVIYEKGDAMTNFDALQKNIASYLRHAGTGNGEQGQRLIVEELTIYNSKARASAAFMGGKTVSVPLPDITLRNIGKARGGVTPGELGQEVVGVLKEKLTQSANFDRLLQSDDQSADKARTSVKGAFY
jgi:hypothetical protein